MKKHLIAIFLFIFGIYTSFAQVERPTVRVMPFTGTGISQSEISVLENIIYSYIVDLNSYLVINEDAIQSNSSLKNSSFNFIISGQINKYDDIVEFELQNKEPSNQKENLTKCSGNSLSDIVIDSKSMVYNIFSEYLTFSKDEEQVLFVSSPQIKDITGTWKGDTGLVNVRIFQNGTALAVLSGGGTLKLHVDEVDDTIIISQNQENKPAMYKIGSITYEMAKIIATQARPMKWIFRLYEDRNILEGTKEAFSVSKVNGELNIDNSLTREARWTRISK